MELHFGVESTEFRLFKDLIFDEFGISLNTSKSALIQSRLAKWIRKYHFANYTELYQHFCSDSSELILLADAITTNVTSFFREEKQWEYFKQHIETLKKKNIKKLRIWSAGCSSGQEPYSIAMFLIENIADLQSWDIKLLATDLSEDVLKKALQGKYQKKQSKGLPNGYIKKYFNTIRKTDSEDILQIKNKIKQMVMFRSFNLVTGNFKIFKNSFDLIFCRNVMIYFDNNTQLQLLKNYSEIMDIGSLLFIGNAESITQEKMPFKLISPSIYKKK